MYRQRPGASRYGSYPTRVRGLKSGDNSGNREAWASYPTRVRGLKCAVFRVIRAHLDVVPYAGTWIEISSATFRRLMPSVVPYAGTWIEMCMQLLTVHWYTSYPTRVRGLKYSFFLPSHNDLKVVPYAGTWIEMYALPVFVSIYRFGRTLRGYVD